MCETYTACRGREARRTGSLTLKVDLILITALATGIGTVIVAFVVSLVGFRSQLSSQSLHRQGDDHFIAIETLMLSGNGLQAVVYFEKGNLTEASTFITLYRRDGNRAFSGNTTIETANGILGRARFPTLDRPPPPGVTMPTPRFTEASHIPPQELFFRDDEGDVLIGGTAFLRAYRPLINLPKRTVCHGADRTGRGVIDIRSNVTEVVRAQALTIGAAGASFVAVVAILAAVIVSFLRRVETQNNDEIGTLARTVNTMVVGLRERFELTKYVSSTTIGALTTGQEPRRVLRTLLFTDVRGFTSFTERRSPEQVAGVLNLLLDKRSTIIQEKGGDIDKFTGDEIVAVFSGDDAPGRARSAALAIMRYCAEHAQEIEGLTVGAGIATGSVIQGMIGSVRRRQRSAGRRERRDPAQRVWLLEPAAAGWQRTTTAVLDHPIAGHQDRLRIPRINAIGLTVRSVPDGSKHRWDFPEGTVIVEEVFETKSPAASEGPIQLTIMVKAPKDRRSQGGWLWITRNMSDGAESVFMGTFCITCHANANEVHPYGDGNPLAEFRDYVFFVPGGGAPRGIPT
jgi:adenylate cyclase